jgi:hypothetical protein
MTSDLWRYRALAQRRMNNAAPNWSGVVFYEYPTLFFF